LPLLTRFLIFAKALLSLAAIRSSKINNFSFNTAEKPDSSQIQFKVLSM